MFPHTVILVWAWFDWFVPHGCLCHFSLFSLSYNSRKYSYKSVSACSCNHIFRIQFEEWKPWAYENTYLGWVCFWLAFLEEIRTYTPINNASQWVSLLSCQRVFDGDGEEDSRKQMSSLDSYRALRKKSLKGVREKLRSPEARLKRQSVPASHLVRGSSLPSVGQHPSQVTRTPRLLCGMQQASSWSLQLPLGLGRPESFGLTVEKGLPAAMPAQTEGSSCLEH